MKQVNYEKVNFGQGFSFTQPVDFAASNKREADRQYAELKETTEFNRSMEDDFNRIQSEIDSINAREAGKNFEGLATLSKTFSEQVGNLNKVLAENAEADEMYGALFGEGLSSEQVRSDAEVDRAATEVAFTNADVANKLQSDTGKISLAQQAYVMDGGVGASFVQGKTNLTQARTLYPSFMMSWMNSDTKLNIGGQTMTVAEASRSGNPALVSAVMATGRQQFLKTYALGNYSKRELVKTLGPTIINTDAQISSNAISSGIKQQRETKISELQSLGYQMAQPGGNIQADFGKLSELFYTSPTGLSRAQANEYAVKALVQGYKDRGDVDGLRELLGVTKIPGQAGTELGGQYGHIINPAIREASSIDRANDKIVEEDIEARMYERLAGAQTLEQKQQIIQGSAQELRGKGLYKQARALEESADDLSVAGNNTRNAAVLLSEIQTGTAGSLQIDQAYLRGDITAEQRDSLKQSLSSSVDFSKPKDAGAAGVAKDYSKKVTSDLFTALGLTVDPTGQITAGSTSGLSKGNAELLKGQIGRDLNAVANQVIRDNPGLSGAQLSAKVQEAMMNWYSDNVTSPQGKYHIPKGLSDTQANKDGTTSQDIVNLRKNTGDKIVNNTLLEPTIFATPNRATGKPQNFLWNVSRDGKPIQGLSSQDAQLFNPLRGDTLFTSAAVGYYIQQYNETGTFDDNLVKAAAALPQIGSPLALLKQQAFAHGITTPVSYQQPQRTQRTASSLSSVEGAQALMRMGVPAKGAAWLSGNIQQESGWIPNRAPWDDVGAPAGGLVSWRAGRLNNLEGAVGPIEQSTTEQQLDYMLKEMRLKYPESYRIFMNPYATDRQLIRASKLYWGYGEEGNRYGYARDIESKL